ncbi:MAG TPA: DUF4331 family protein [Gemmatimonadaceae bacterium]|nr:DUF4331 family protein [Gemmatimonadaceae bacterium]
MLPSHIPRPPRRRHRAAALLALTVACAAGVARVALGSDHQDTPEVELSPRMDINDVYAFPGASADRIVLVLTTSSPIAPGADASFDPNLLYQIKVDNSGDAVEDLVLQFTFDGMGASQRVHLRGPVAPAQTGTSNTLVATAPQLTGAVNQVLGSATGVQLFAGLRDDPFFIDLEQFFRIVPDRRPATGPLSTIGPEPEASAFRDPGIDYVRGFNTLAMVVELPVAMLTGGGSGRLGLWGTTSR